MSQRVTLQTLADRLGVSRTTVSNAWSRPDQLSTEVRERILALADELGYPGPDPAARGLRRGRADAIGLLLTETLEYAFGDPHAHELLRGVAAAIEEADIGLLVVPLPPQRLVGDALRSAVIDGCLVYSMPEDHPALDVLVRRGIPLVTIDGPRLPGVPFVGIDDRGASRELAELVVSYGHRHVLVLSIRTIDDLYDGPIDRERLSRSVYLNSRERIAGTFEATDAAGVPRDGIVLHEVSRNHRSAAQEVVARALAADRPPTAIIALSDELAAGALDAATAAGRVPGGDITIVGFDDQESAAHLNLTTVRQSAYDKGYRAAAQLVGGGPSGDIVLPHELVRRGSVGPVPS
ncbi:LacI family DNA-binding transcriptional regulator [Actinomarinicola tropica]|uniref:Substrate-binding domain-containing protein n=1 Tax=Actinomarinicola tropica TaxID=2789776 RepID=A0A5Q2RR79_9ACTN|nr:LacI family DNA-binding transcriptional regulator [Actinomarinicola tropica]QGG96410.1 substrate-binding domain-containing protein [Actinomarinicola tropica]